MIYILNLIHPDNRQLHISKGFKSWILCFDEKNTAPKVNLRAHRKLIYPPNFFWSNQISSLHQKKRRNLTLLTKKPRTLRKLIRARPEADFFRQIKSGLINKSHDFDAVFWQEKLASAPEVDSCTARSVFSRQITSDLFDKISRLWCCVLTRKIVSATKVDS